MLSRLQKSAQQINPKTTQNETPTTPIRPYYLFNKL